ncbi:hypothetical protein [uncultured Roseobacter sp.]|uniref:hypothetical protein n=1 Tax=uncultured Roseobacter sp. TaxID=114847 RepID=UPI00262E1F9E|nr:hypothetical protein [uncultured Roseobacter sp.]
MTETEFDWHRASAELRKTPTKTLYRILRDLHQQVGGRFDDLFEKAQGVPLTVSLDPYCNIKRGVYDRTKMQNIHEWLATNHFAFAQVQAPDLFQYPRRDPWEVFLEDHAFDGGLSINPADGFGIASRKPREDTLPEFRVGQTYLFELTAPQTTYVLAFEEYDAKWYPLGLGETKKDFIVQVGRGTTKLPCTKDGIPIPLSENDHPGIHRFAFVLCLGPKPPIGQQALMRHAEANDVTVMQISMRVIN